VPAVKDRADQISGQFNATIIGIIYFWLANPDALEKTKELHEGLKVTMKELIKNCG
jgi:hypothetical protein